MSVVALQVPDTPNAAFVSSDMLLFSMNADTVACREGKRDEMSVHVNNLPERRIYMPHIRPQAAVMGNRNAEFR